MEVEGAVDSYMTRYRRLSGQSQASAADLSRALDGRSLPRQDDELDQEGSPVAYVLRRRRSSQLDENQEIDGEGTVVGSITLSVSFDDLPLMALGFAPGRHQASF